MTTNMAVVVEFKTRGWGARHYVTNLCDKKCPERYLWCHKLDPTTPRMISGRVLVGGWETKSIKSSQILHGPASCRTSKRVYYPCTQHGCFVGCPCSLCHGDSSSPTNSKASIKELFDGHELYHNAYHLGCIFCVEIFRMIPFYNYASFVLEGPFGIKHAVPESSYVFHHSIALIKMSMVEQLRCEECDLTFNESFNKYRHDRAKHLKKTFSCNECDKQFNRADILDRHIKNVHEATLPLDCKDCHTKFKRLDNLERHRSAQFDKDGKAGNVCHECGDEFCSPKFLKLHMKKNHGQLTCEDCQENFSRKSSLNAHISRGKIACDVCSTVMCNQRQLLVHKTTFHGVKQKFQCDECNAKFDKKWLLERHKKMQQSLFVIFVYSTSAIAIA